ncbi:Cgi121p KNAG_0B03380 [Huiozyma naganishii CBS 8797]|uniref:EKC/KEOPS complex subunit CGI121 n=1 Tax=Huiozyma naganishii (strain ATCC MYA-139 / BCRC 22969 / CBS 8797 / KCTC 17520 / NBRC 10181 / NCYC 3082 / Yp74L-3) TaxID=1071383 RepID=J7R1T9_HUIN7|nr:hypothetical protein KNAG_0B03380 [Kazachstania naganishii CBS 8797]CCK68780.1 hypothetical protein KNAG_0B03380 [Kazachstania naganishii CBS 8797]
MLQTKLPQFPKYKVDISLFRDVQNSNELKTKVAELPYAFIDAKTICSREQLLSAVYRALDEVTYNKMRTKSLHSECLLCLSPTSNIGDAFHKFGIKEDSREVICLQLSKVEQHEVPPFHVFVKGIEVAFDDEHLGQFYDKELLRRIYKLDSSSQPQSRESLSRAVVNAIHLRGL